MDDTNLDTMEFVLATELADLREQEENLRKEFNEKIDKKNICKIMKISDRIIICYTYDGWESTVEKGYNSNDKIIELTSREIFKEGDYLYRGLGRGIYAKIPADYEFIKSLPEEENVSRTLTDEQIEDLLGEDYFLDKDKLQVIRDEVIKVNKEIEEERIKREEEEKKEEEKENKNYEEIYSKTGEYEHIYNSETRYGVKGRIVYSKILDRVVIPRSANNKETWIEKEILSFDKDIKELLGFYDLRHVPFENYDYEIVAYMFKEANADFKTTFDYNTHGTWNTPGKAVSITASKKGGKCYFEDVPIARTRFKFLLERYGKEINTKKDIELYNKLSEIKIAVLELKEISLRASEWGYGDKNVKVPVTFELVDEDTFKMDIIGKSITSPWMKLKDVFCQGRSVYSEINYSKLYQIIDTQITRKDYLEMIGKYRMANELKKSIKEEEN